MDCPEGVKMTIEQLPGGGKGSGDGHMQLTMEKPGKPGGVEIPPMSSIPPTPRGDATLPDGSTLGGRPNPTGGGGIEDTSSDIDEMGFSMDTSLGGMGMEFDMDMGMDVQISDQEVNQMTDHIYEDTSVDDTFTEEQTETTTQAEENVDNTNQSTKEQSQNSDEENLNI